MSAALKPCPFCGAPAGKPRKITADERSGYQETVTISCGKGCGAIVGVNGSLNKSGWSDAAAGATEVAAIAAWNRRAPLPEEEGMVERVARAICEAPPRTVETADGTTVELAGCPEPGACKLCSYGARAAIRAINGGEP